MSARSQHEFTRTGLFDNSTVFKTVSTIGVLNSIRAVPHYLLDGNVLTLLTTKLPNYPPSPFLACPIHV